MPVKNIGKDRLTLAGIHHATAITADGEACERFYSELLGFERVDPGLGHEGEEIAFAGCRDGSGLPMLSFVVDPDAAPARGGPGSANVVLWQVGDREELLGWWERLVAGAVRTVATRGPRGEPALRFWGPEGLMHELIAADSGPGVAPVARARAGRRSAPMPRLVGARANCADLIATADILSGRLDFALAGERAFRLGRDDGYGLYICDPAPPTRARAGAGAIDHVAWTCAFGEQRIWRQRVIGMGMRVSPVLEAEQLRSIYFREPSGVKFEVVTELETVLA